MRLKTDFFIAALTRRIFATGSFAAVERKGAEEAGAIFIRQRTRNGRMTLYGPAPQSYFDEGEAAGTRLFEIRLEQAEAEAISEILDREIRYDPDLWIVEIEIDDIADLIEIAKPDAS